ncbi:MAG: DUF3857 domain-containing protein [Akkermansiaceae bacterium]
MYTQAGRDDEALVLAQELATEFPNNQQFQTDLAIALINASKGKEAHETLDALLTKTPNEAFLLYQKGRAFQVEKNFQKSKEHYELALKSAPGDPTIGEALAIVSALLGQGDQSSIRTPIKPVEIPPPLAEALSKVTQPTENQGFNTRILRDLTGHYFRKGEPFRSTRTRTVKVFNQAGVEEYKSIRFDFDPTYERALINLIEVTDSEGQILSKDQRVESYVSDTSAQDGAMATTASTVNATIPGLKPGCTLRYQFTVETLGNSDHFPFDFSLLASLSPGGPIGHFITGDLDQITVNTSQTAFLNTSDDNHRSWYLEQCPRYHQETHHPSLDTFLPFVAIGPQGTKWSELGDKYLQDLNDRLESTDEITRLADELTKGLETPDEKAAAIVRHIQDQLVYQAIEFGVRGRIPERTSRILSNRYGDCKDHSLLIYQLLKSSGIPAHLALVHTYNPPVDRSPSLDQFNHMIVYAPSIRGCSFFDATGKNTPVETRSTVTLAGIDALILEKGKSRLMEIPSNPAIKHEVICKRKITVHPEKEELSIQEHITLHGSYAGGLRGYLRSINKAERNLLLEQILGNRVLLAIDELELQNLEDPEKPLLVEMTYTVKDSFQNRGKTTEAIMPAIWEEFYLRINQSGKRHTPFEIRVPVKLTSQISLKIPESIEIVSPAWQDSGSDSPEYFHSLISKGGKSARNTVEIKKGLYPKDPFNHYTQSLSKTLKGLQGTLQFKTKN